MGFEGLAAGLRSLARIGDLRDDIRSGQISAAQAEAYVRIAERLHLDSLIVECACEPARAASSNGVLRLIEAGRSTSGSDGAAAPKWMSILVDWVGAASVVPACR